MNQLKDWWRIVHKHTSSFYEVACNSSPKLGWQVLIGLLLLSPWLIWMGLISLFYTLKDMYVCAASSGKAARALVYGMLIVAVVPRVFPNVNWDYFYSKITGSYTTFVDRGPTACLTEYKMNRFATAENHVPIIRGFLKNMGFMDSPEEMQTYINKYATGPFPCQVTGEMVWESSQEHKVSGRLMLAIMHIESHFGTAANRAGKPSRAVNTKNPGNVGNVDSGDNSYCDTWQEGVDRLAKWLNRNRTIVISDEPRSW